MPATTYISKTMQWNQSGVHTSYACILPMAEDHKAISWHMSFNTNCEVINRRFRDQFTWTVEIKSKSNVFTTHQLWMKAMMFQKLLKSWYSSVRQMTNFLSMKNSQPFEVCRVQLKNSCTWNWKKQFIRTKMGNNLYLGILGWYMTLIILPSPHQ
jgi:predicted ATP-binding protein involved in virulence